MLVENVYFFFKKYFCCKSSNSIVFKRTKSCYLNEMTFQITLRPPLESSLLPLWPIDGKDSLFGLISHSGDLFHQLIIKEKGKQDWILKFNTKKKSCLDGPILAFRRSGLQYPKPLVSIFLIFRTTGVCLELSKWTTKLLWKKFTQEIENLPRWLFWNHKAEFKTLLLDQVWVWITR